MKQKLQKYIITGIMSIIPIALTYWIIKNLFLFFSGPGGSIIGIFFPESLNSKYVIAGFTVISPMQKILGFILTIIFLYILGLVISNVIGKKMYKFFESILSKIPVVSRIYKSIKQITATLSMPNSKAFQKVVLIEYPRKGVWTICMVTGETMDKEELYYNVFVPTTPNPTSGYLLFIKASETKELQMSVEDGLKIIISGGMIGPDEFNING
mgnify:FL=1|tara:strand:+ start:22560 stop:23195 length:636 start_codon:yes stop_codon:yes gene_type:complete